MDLSIDSLGEKVSVREKCKLRAMRLPLAFLVNSDASSKV